MIQNTYQKECPNCGEAYIGSRLNQIYCSAKCKARYNNRKAKEIEIAQKTIRRITYSKNRILWENRQLLKKYAGQQMEIELLQEEGFRLNYITDFYEDQEGDNILRIYDYGYYFINETLIKIFQV